MKAEERKRLERNELADRLSHYWTAANSNSPRASRFWLVALVGLLAILGWVFYARLAAQWDKTRWADLVFATDTENLTRLVKDEPATVQAGIARMQLARSQMRESLNELAVLNPDRRLAAATRLEEARKSFAELAGDTRLPPPLIQEAMAQRARAEETLAAVPQADNPSAMRGSLDEALKLYDELKARYPTSVNGEQAAARAEQLRKHRAEVEKLMASLVVDHGKAPAAPALPTGVTPAAPTPADVGPPANP